MDDAAGRGTHRRVEERRADRRVDSLKTRVYEQHSPVLGWNPPCRQIPSAVATP